jgi:hypothetical protein
VVAKSKLVTTCPGCSAALQVARLSCPRCAMQLEGSFQIPPLLRLPPEDLEFVVAFVRESGSLKAMAQRLGQSYPTIRNRLDGIIAKLSDVGRDADALRHEILDAISKGEMTAEEGARRLREVTG